METKKIYLKPFIGAFLIGLICIFIYFQKETRYNQVLENKKITKGQVIDFQYSNLIYVLNYEYDIEGKKYSNSIYVRFFKCDDGTKGCKGKEFPVYYSSKDPYNSDIDLGKYNKYKK